uniref:carbon-nitrogen hydrolase family protein n=1 Tax=uncultured Acinetobacter sp. TaxID=165433 RepID=UPI0026089494|nr:carbon-nitrogen hydrolase family protein [uncultured Acinetobacter sp.]
MVLLAVTQLNSQDNIDANFSTVEQLIMDAKAQHAELIVLPENFACFATGQQLATAERFDELKARIEQLAFEHQMWIIAGTLPCPYRPDGVIVPDGRVRTTSLCISPEGKTVARYDKIHLFDVQVGDHIGAYQESKVFEAGDQPVVVNTPFGNIGMMICYDLRFPEFAIKLRGLGAELLSAPSAFTYHTGEMHWQLLLQARAMDTQCMTLGSAQQGTHGKRQTWGHSLICQSQGKILAQTDQEGAQLIIAPFDLDAQNQIRASMPLQSHRKFI